MFLNGNCEIDFPNMKKQTATTKRVESEEPRMESPRLGE
jgi:hypothetical protein